jgi:hypothetical protein
MLQRICGNPGAFVIHLTLHPIIFDQISRCENTKMYIDAWEGATVTSIRSIRN